MNYTDEQLKRALAKMLPDTLQLVPYGREDNLILCWNLEGLSEPVRNTELLHLCWVVEETLNNAEYGDYFEYLATSAHAIYRDSALCHATWQQRVEALAKVKGIEI